MTSLGIKTVKPLLTGTFSQDTFVRSLGTGDLKLQGGAFINSVDPSLAAYFGLPSGGTMYLGGLSTLFSAPANGTGESPAALGAVGEVCRPRLLDVRPGSAGSGSRTGCG